MAIVIGSILASAPAPAEASTTSMASGPYATELIASSDSAGMPSMLVICPFSAPPGRGHPVARPARSGSEPA